MNAVNDKKKLHPRLPNSVIPKILKEKLVFGNPEQIKALSALQKEYFGDATDETENKKLYSVSIEAQYDATVLVMACDKLEAETLAQENFIPPSLRNSDFSFYAREIKD